ncbi:MAG TPA: DUF501 domain-containing protein [Acidimicrobiia bacterium]
MGTPADVEMVTEQLGRAPLAEFDVVVRRADGRPVVIRNAPFLADGTPMPTRFWLVDTALVTSVARLESDGGVRAAEAAIVAEELRAAHRDYEHERNGAIAPGTPGPRPSGGVGGTREGVKCLHAHYAHWLAGGRDPVGEWVAERLAEAPIAEVSR